MNFNKIILFFTIGLGIVFWVIIIGIGTFTVVMPAKRDLNLPYYLPIVIKNAHDIQLGTRVQILGIDQGYIKYIDYFPLDKDGNFIFISDCKDLCQDKTYDQILLAILNIRKELEFYENYRIYTRYNNVLGEKVIEIDPGSKFVIKNQKKFEQKRIEIKYLTPNELFSLMNNQSIPLNKKEILFASNYDDPVTIVAEVVYENRKTIQRIFKNTAEITHKINKGNGTIGLLLNEHIVLTNTDKTLLEIILLIRDLRESLESLREHKILSNTFSGILSTISP
jgi:phospholipid/cholesterol/gamma-HCH transport system substrate-binding protein